MMFKTQEPFAGEDPRPPGLGPDMGGRSAERYQKITGKNNQASIFFLKTSGTGLQ